MPTKRKDPLDPAAKIRQRTVKTLSAAVINLIDARNKFGHWGDVRSTALALWALNDSLVRAKALPDCLVDLRKQLGQTASWLSHQARPEKQGVVSWESEAWDTALAILALTSFDHKRYAPQIGQGIRWLGDINQPHTGVWYDEIWETTLSTIALVRTELLRTGRRNAEIPSSIERILEWMCAIPSKSENDDSRPEFGEYVCPHYTGFLVWLRGEIKRCFGASSRKKSIPFQGFQSKSDAALKWLLSCLDKPNPRLWSTDTFSNSYIVLGIMSAAKDKLTIDHMDRISKWFKGSQGKDGGFEDTEDTALAILALTALFRQVGFDKDLLTSQLIKFAAARTVRYPCFLGYSKNAHAFAMDVKQHIARSFPMVELIDWECDFEHGAVLYEEIMAACDRSHAALFLVTKDRGKDPSNNVIFEYGYFSACLGTRKTILIVEEGAEPPTDFKPILHVHVQDRNDFDSARDELDRALRAALGL